jgi:hypothetical protein
MSMKKNGGRWAVLKSGAGKLLDLAAKAVNNAAERARPDGAPRLRPDHC